MSQTIKERLAELNVELPAATRSVANYLPVTASGNVILTSGQLPLADGKLTATGCWDESSMWWRVRSQPDSVP
jgi:enamine deaminase RidA (YjgF/YER057c/UK114 family)